MSRPPKGEIHDPLRFSCEPSASDVSRTGVIPLISETHKTQIAQVGMIHTWRFARRGGAVLMAHAVFLTMAHIASVALPNETGGTLVGRYEADGSLAIIEEALSVHRGARQDRTHFFRPADEVDGQLAEIFRTSNGRTYYLGEWHTHPGSTSSPSRLDLRTVRDLARSPTVATDTPLLLILGGCITEAPTIRCLVVDANGTCESARYLGTRAEISGGLIHMHEG